jgi:hypothetical protein
VTWIQLLGRDERPNRLREFRERDLRGGAPCRRTAESEKSDRFQSARVRAGNSDRANDSQKRNACVTIGYGLFAAAVKPSNIPGARNANESGRFVGHQ